MAEQMANEKKSSCVTAGIALLGDYRSFRKATPIIYPDNVKGLVKTEDLKVPSSELAMHSGADGKDLLAFALTGTSTALIIYNDGEGGCKFLHGSEGEVMPKALVDKVSEIWEKRGPD